MLLLQMSRRRRLAPHLILVGQLLDDSGGNCLPNASELMCVLFVSQFLGAMIAVWHVGGDVRRVSLLGSVVRYLHCGQSSRPDVGTAPCARGGSVVTTGTGRLDNLSNEIGYLHFDMEFQEIDQGVELNVATSLLERDRRDNKIHGFQGVGGIHEAIGE